MTSAPYHHDHEAIRKTLYGLNILDTPIEERFQRITRMVCAALGVPVSAFSIIDGERQWFKSIQGMDATENTRAESFCAYTILSDDIMVVPDATKDIRFSGNPLVKGDPGIAFYAGCPIRAPDGRNIGSLCAIDMKVRSITPDQLQVLRDLAMMLESELKAAQMSQSQYDLIHELDAANRLLRIDPVTRLWNRIGLEELLKRDYARAESQKKTLSFLLFEIGTLEGITYKYGRNVTEHLIKETGKRLLASVSAGDSLGRIEGDRFALIMTHDDPESAVRKGRDICRAVSGKSFSIGDTELPFKIRAGVIPEITSLPAGLDNLVAAAEKTFPPY